MMEEYVARDALVEFACQGDVVGCDVYVGLFAWRYGCVPEARNRERKSVTELEYSAADGRIPRLVFLLKDKARWPSKSKDSDLTRVADLRAKLKKTCAAYFSGRSDLAVEVLASLRVLEATRFAKKMDAVVDIQQAPALGPSYLMNIKAKMRGFRESPIVEIQTLAVWPQFGVMDPVPWWNTRLHLISALADEIGGSKEFVFVDGSRKFLTMAPPAEIRRRLARRWPKLEQAYIEFRHAAPSLGSIEENLAVYPQAVRTVFGLEESQAKEVVTERDLESELGIASDADIVTVERKGQEFLLREILNRPTPFVALTRDGILEGLVDTRDLARRVANSALGQFN